MSDYKIDKRKKEKHPRPDLSRHEYEQPREPFPELEEANFHPMEDLEDFPVIQLKEEIPNKTPKASSLDKDLAAFITVCEALKELSDYQRRKVLIWVEDKFKEETY